tara:strand:- start:790 stop:1068 length:279 start_codon:yes stop_codon:yes gene_type:complete
MTKKKEVQIGSRYLKPGDRVVQSRSIHCFHPNTTGFPWEVDKTWAAGEMARLKYVGACGTLDKGYANAVLTKYLVRQSDWEKVEKFNKENAK